MLVLVTIQTSTHQMQGDVLQSACVTVARWHLATICDDSGVSCYTHLSLVLPVHILQDILPSNPQYILVLVNLTNKHRSYTRNHADYILLAQHGLLSSALNIFFCSRRIIFHNVFWWLFSCLCLEHDQLWRTWWSRTVFFVIYSCRDTEKLLSCQ